MLTDTALNAEHLWLRALATHVAQTRFYVVDIETGHRCAYASVWPAALAADALAWLDAGLPAWPQGRFAETMHRARTTRWAHADGHISTAPAALADELARALEALAQTPAFPAFAIEGALWERQQQDMHP